MTTERNSSGPGRSAELRGLRERLRDTEGRLRDAEERQAATGQILRVVSRSPADVQPVFDTIVAAALRLCAATSANVVTFDGSLVHVAAVAPADREGSGALRRHFDTYPRPPSRDTANTRAILTRAVVVIPDVLQDPDYGAGATAVAAGYRSVLSVPLMRDGRPIGAVTVARPEPGPFPETQVALLQTFADQAAIAIENARLFTELGARNRELTEALEHQTATSEILNVISRSQTEVQPVFDTIAAAVLDLCHAEFANVFTYDGALIHLAACVNNNPAYVEILNRFFPRPPGRETGATRAIQTGSICVIPDVLEDADYAIPESSAVSGFRSVLAVPLLREDKPIGAIAVGRPMPGAFPDAQVALLRTFADQAVIAIENVRLFNELQARNRELTEALEQQTATSDILRVISRSRTNAQPVFDTIVRNAVALCDSLFAIVFRYDGRLLHYVASHNAGASYVELIQEKYPIPPDSSQVSGRVILSKSIVVLEDATSDPEYDQRFPIAMGWRRMLGVPMMRDGEPLGVIVVAWTEPGTVPKAQEDLLRTFADQAVIAIENVRLFRELEARTDDLTRSVRELKALGEVGQAVSSTLDLEAVLRTIVSRARALAGMDGGAIYEYDETHERFHVRATDSLAEPLVDALRASPIPKGEGAIGQLAVTGQPVQIRDIVEDPGYQSRVRELLIDLGYRSLLAVPLLREQHLLGGLVVNRCASGEFAAEVIDLLKTFATQSALAIQNARLYRELEAKSRELEAASRHKSEFLANMSHELRTPLNAIIGFSEVLSERMFGELNDKQTEYVRDILESGQHLLSLINDILDLSKIEAGRMELEAADFDLPDAIGNALILVKERAVRRGIRLASSIEDRLGVVHGDERKVKQVLLNLLSNALKFTPEGGRIDVSAVVRDGAAEISVADTGSGIAAEDQEAVFEEFRQVGATAKKVEGTGLGLAISRKFVELHGGRIWVESRLGAGSTFRFTLPLHAAVRSR